MEELRTSEIKLPGEKSESETFQYIVIKLGNE